MLDQIPPLVDDKTIAKTLRVSRSCIRGQRHKRFHGEDHWLDLEPVMVGSLPRYRIKDVEAFMAGLKSPAREAA